MDSTTQFFVGIVLLVAGSLLVGEAMSRLGLLPLVGQLAVGIIFGPTLLGPALGLSGLAGQLQGLQILSTFFVLVSAGLAVSPGRVAAAGAPAAVLGFTIFALPFLLGTFVVRLLYPGLSPSSDVFAALTLSITALPVLAVMLREFGLLDGRLGTLLLSGAFLNELAAVATFAILLRFRTGTGGLLTAIGITLVAVALFVGSVLAAHQILKQFRESAGGQRASSWLRRTWRSREAGFAVVMAAALGSALYTQYLGLTYLVGSFCAGLLVTPESAGVEAYRSVRRVFDTVTWGFFVPLFAALIGLQMNLRLVAGSWATLAAFAGLCGFALVAKLAIGGAVCRAAGAPARTSVGSGFLLASRGAVELAMASLLLSLGIFTSSLFSIVAGVGLVTTLLSPIGARPFLSQGPTLSEWDPARPVLD